MESGGEVRLDQNQSGEKEEYRAMEILIENVVAIGRAAGVA